MINYMYITLILYGWYTIMTWQLSFITTAWLKQLQKCHLKGPFGLFVCVCVHSQCDQHLRDLYDKKWCGTGPTGYRKGHSERRVLECQWSWRPFQTRWWWPTIVARMLHDVSVQESGMASSGESNHPARLVTPVYVLGHSEKVSSWFGILISFRNTHCQAVMKFTHTVTH